MRGIRLLVIPLGGRRVSGRNDGWVFVSCDLGRFSAVAFNRENSYYDCQVRFYVYDCVDYIDLISWTLLQYVCRYYIDRLILSAPQNTLARVSVS
jgi:hypothetical protein